MFILNPAMIAGHVFFRGWSGIRAHVLLVLAIPRPASRTRGISAAAVVAFALFILDSAMRTGHVFFRGWSGIRAHVLLVLAILGSTGRASRVDAVAVMASAFFILDAAMITGHVFVRRGIIGFRIIGVWIVRFTCMIFVGLTPIFPACFTDRITASSANVRLMLAIILFAVIAFRIFTTTDMIPQMLTVLRSAMRTGSEDTAAIMVFSGFVSRPAMLTGYIRFRGTLVHSMLAILRAASRARGVDAAAVMSSLMLAILRSAMRTGSEDTAAVVIRAGFILRSTVGTGHVCYRIDRIVRIDRVIRINWIVRINRIIRIYRVWIRVWIIHAGMLHMLTIFCSAVITGLHYTAAIVILMLAMLHPAMTA